MIRAITPTIDDLETFIRYVYAPHHLGITDGTIDGYCFAARLWQQWAGQSILPQEFSEDLLLRWLAARLKESAPKTVKGNRAAMLAVWRWAADSGHCDRAPKKVPTVKVPRKKPVCWRPEEAAKAITQAYQLTGTIRGTSISKADWWGSLLTFLYWVGARVGAAIAVKTSDVDLSRGIVILRGEDAKTDEEQVLRVHQQAVDAISKHCDAQREFVWPWPYHPRQLWTDLETILVAAGLPKDRRSKFHRWRKTTYTMCAKAGGIAVAGKQLGHKTDMSAYYLDPSMLDDVQAADLMPVLPL